MSNVRFEQERSVLARVLITGSNGMIGTALMHYLPTKGFKVLGALRSPPLSCQDNHQNYFIVGDIHQSTDWTESLKNIEVVIHTAACVHQMQGSKDYDIVNHLATHQLVKQAAESGVKRFIFLSSIKAMGEDGHFDQSTICAPQDDYGRSKLAAELKIIEVSEQSGMEFVILRLPLIYGPGVKANFRKLMQMVRLCTLKHIPLPFKGIKNARSMMGLGNLVDCISRCIDHPRAARKIYLPSDGSPISTPELIQKIGRVLGISNQKNPVFMFFVPTFLLKLGFGCMGKKALVDRLLGDLTVDSRPIQEDLSWQAPYTVDEELRYTIDAFIKSS